LLEAPFAYSPFKKEEWVKLVFPDPDKDGRILLMKTITAAVGSNIINLDEARVELGKKPYDKNTWKRTAWEMFQKEEVELAHPKSMSTETVAHTKDDTTSPTPAGVSTSKKPAPQKPQKPKPTVTTTTKNIIKSSFNNIYNLICNNKPVDLDELLYYIKGNNYVQIFTDFFNDTIIIINNSTKEDIPFVIISREILMDELINEYISNVVLEREVPVLEE
jgi:hypothetical protein